MVKMKSTFIMKALAVFAVSSPVHCAPVENQLNEVAELGDHPLPYCVKFYEDTYLKGKSAFTYVVFNLCNLGKIASCNTTQRQ